MLRPNTRARLNEILESSYFGVENFDVRYGATDGSLLAIRFIPDPTAKFDVQIGERNRRFRISEVPGVRLQVQEIAFSEDLDEVLDRLAAWTERLREDMLARSPWAREVQELRAAFVERLATLDEDLEGFFTREEASALSVSLAELRSRVDKLTEDNAELKATAGALAQSVADLLSAADRVNRGTWYRMAAGRLLSGMKGLATSKEAREFALEAAKKLLLEGPK